MASTSRWTCARALVRFPSAPLFAALLFCAIVIIYLQQQVFLLRERMGALGELTLQTKHSERLISLFYYFILVFHFFFSEHPSLFSFQSISFHCTIIHVVMNRAPYPLFHQWILLFVFHWAFLTLEPVFFFLWHAEQMYISICITGRLKPWCGLNQRVSFDIFNWLNKMFYS